MHVTHSELTSTLSPAGLHSLVRGYLLLDRADLKRAAEGASGSSNDRELPPPDGADEDYEPELFNETPGEGCQRVPRESQSVCHGQAWESYRENQVIVELDWNLLFTTILF